jgi:hypothetical protein
MVFSLYLPVHAVSSSGMYSDVSATECYFNAIRMVSLTELMIGVGNSKFAPDIAFTRAMLAKVLYNYDGCPVSNASVVLRDVPIGAWYTDAVLWAVGSGYMSDMGWNMFHPLEPVTREEIAAVLWNYIQSYDGLYGLNDSMDIRSLNDYSEIRPESRSAVANILANGIMQITSNNEFLSQQILTRAEAAEIFARCIEFFLYAVPSTVMNVNGYENVIMTVDKSKVTSTGIALILENKSNTYAYSYGEYYVLERDVGGVWYQIPVTINDVWGFSFIAYYVLPDETQKWSVDWEWLYGKLESGHYRIIKDITIKAFDNEDHNIRRDNYVLAAEFTIR